MSNCDVVTNEAATNKESIDIVLLNQKLANQDKNLKKMQNKCAELMQYKSECHSLRTRIIELEGLLKGFKKEALRYQQKQMDYDNKQKETNAMISKSITKCDTLNASLRECVKQRDVLQAENSKLQCSLQSLELEKSIICEQMSSYKLNNEILTEKCASLTLNNISQNYSNLNDSQTLLESEKSPIFLKYKQKLRNISSIANDVKSNISMN